MTSSEPIEKNGDSKNKYAKWFSRAVWLGILADWLLGVPIIFAPRRTLETIGFRTPADPVWAAFAALLVVLLSLFYIPGAVNPSRYRFNAKLAVWARPPGVLFFLILYPGYYPAFGLLDGLLFLVQFPLLWLTLRSVSEWQEPGVDTLQVKPDDRSAIWLGEGLDGGDGRLRLGRSWLPPWRKGLKLDWDVKGSEGVINSIIDMHRRLSEMEGGRLNIPFYWQWLGTLVTVHPLGGCSVGSSPQEGVVDHRGQVFGYRNLYVADGAQIPAPIGRNPSMTIAALAERAADLIQQEM